MYVYEADLGPLRPISDGAFGTVYGADNYFLPDDQTQLAYKRFKTENALDSADSAIAVLTFRESLNSDQVAELDRYTAWPRALVYDNTQQVCGLLMPLLPKRFFVQLIDPDTGVHGPKPREMSWLVASKKTIKAAEADIRDLDEGERLFLLAQLVFAVGLLHKYRWVYGDLSFKNVVYALDPPQIVLIDCDSAASLDNQERKQYFTPFWELPETPDGDETPDKDGETSGETGDESDDDVMSLAYVPTKKDGKPPLQDHATDVYKLGLAILRCLTPGRNANQNKSLATIRNQLDIDGKVLLAKALSRTPEERPSARDLYSYLKKTTTRYVAAPEIVKAVLATPIRLRGQDVRIDWRLARTSEITVIIANRRLAPVRHSNNVDGFSFWPDLSGPVSIEVRNNYGTTTASLGDLVLYELPSFHVDLESLPRPDIPEVEAVPVGAVATALLGDPSAKVGFPDIPEVGPPQMFGYTASLNPRLSVAAPGPRIERALTEASGKISQLIIDAEQKYLAKLTNAMSGDGDG